MKSNSYIEHYSDILPFNMRKKIGMNNKSICPQDIPCLSILNQYMKYTFQKSRDLSSLTIVYIYIDCYITVLYIYVGLGEIWWCF